ncbi:hypothetical protein [Pseudanabaena sp. PCC 6802]|uniref:hypothetical protein n=1 Tax=Pseudanabaena sp. PCC 6802 TaxID=118173 RepID=UPI000346E1D1|nr:hypothetical protein [Pseudanabaena sp. PCC 6802]
MSGEFDEGEKLIAIPAPSRCDRDVRPQWKFFCCCDGGLVDNPYLSQLVSGKNGKPFICQRLDCKAGEKYRNAYFATDAQRQDYTQKHGGEVMTQQEYQAQWDIRLTAAHCEQMHLWHKQYWDTWAAQRAKRLNYGQSISHLTQQLSMPIKKERR